MTAYDRWLEAPYAAQDAADARWERRCDRLDALRPKLADEVAGLLDGAFGGEGIDLTGKEINGPLLNAATVLLNGLEYERLDEIAVTLGLIEGEED